MSRCSELTCHCLGIQQKIPRTILEVPAAVTFTRREVEQILYPIDCFVHNYFYKALVRKIIQ